MSKKRSPGFSGKNRGVTPSVAARMSPTLVTPLRLMIVIIINRWHCSSKQQSAWPAIVSDSTAVHFIRISRHERQQSYPAPASAAAVSRRSVCLVRFYHLQRRRSQPAESIRRLAQDIWILALRWKLCCVVLRAAGLRTWTQNGCVSRRCRLSAKYWRWILHRNGAVSSQSLLGT